MLRAASSGRPEDAPKVPREPQQRRHGDGPWMLVKGTAQRQNSRLGGFLKISTVFSDPSAGVRPDTRHNPGGTHGDEPRASSLG